MSSKPRLRRTAAVLVCALASVVASSARAQDAGVRRDSGLPWAGAAGDTGVPTADAGPAATPDSGGPPAPWSQATDVPLPSFLDTTDRRIHDDRPPPTPEQIAALHEMEAEASLFTKAGGSYRGAIDSILRREYQRQRREREQGYARQIREEERLQNEARADAIVRFERFVRNYPNDPVYTPDAMFRLGELYYERDAIAFQDSGEDAAATTGHPDFSATVGMYRDLVARFPGYRRADGVYYLIGYCLGEMGELEEANSAWLNLVCANRFHYTGPAAPPTALAPEPPPDTSLAASHPSGSIDIGTPAAPPPDAPYADPYVGCTPVQPDAEFVTETWLRIGEYHFDYDPLPHFLDRAISAYNHVLSDPTDHNYNLALYKVAWAYYRASRYPEAIQHFAMLIDWSDSEQERTGHAGSELRAEAVQYLGITFGYDDWNEDGMPDTTTGIQRIQDPSLLPQDRPWTPEIYFSLGQTYFDEAHYDLAIQVWQLALQRWPLNFRAGEIRMQIARAYGRLNDIAHQTQTEDEIAAMGQGSDWWQANMDHAREQTAVEDRAQSALINQALRIHQQATHDRQEAVREHDAALLQRAIGEYNDAATAYRTFIQRYPNSPDSYTLEYNLADALFWSEQYEDAAQAYGAVRDSNLDDQYLSESARRVVESLKRLLDAAVARHEVEVRTAPPEPVNGHVQPIEMPQLVQRVAQAREVYLARVDEAHDTEHLRGDYSYNNTLLLYYYGYWDQARDRFRDLYLAHCAGATGSEVGQVAWQNLYNMAVAANDTAEVSRLSHDVLDRHCTFSADGTAPTASDADCACGTPNLPPVCIAHCGITDVEFREANSEYERCRGSTPATDLCPATVTPDMVTCYEHAASMFVTAVNAHPNHDHAPDALIQAAIALECTSRFESASHLYSRVIDEVGPRAASEAVPQERLDSILGTAYFRLAYTANRFFDYDRAVQNYRTIADSQRFQRSTDPQMPGRRTDSLINAAHILEWQQDYTHATDYYRRVTDALASATDGDSIATRRTAFYRIAEMSYQRHDWTGTVRDMQAFIDRYRSDRAAGELVVQASWRIAQARLAQHNTSGYTQALNTVVSTFAASGQLPGSIAAEYAANAKFILVDPDGQAFETFAIDTRRGHTVQTYIAGIVAQISAGSTRAQGIAQEYEPIMAYNRPVWTVAALVAQGRIYEVLAHSIVAAQHPLPEDLTHQIAHASEDVRTEIQTQFDDRIRQAMEPQIAPVECLAVVRYALAARAAHAGSLDTDATRAAIDRLQAYGDDRIAQCITDQRTHDATFAAYTPGEFTRARAGQTASVPDDRGPPPLAAATGGGR